MSEPNEATPEIKIPKLFCPKCEDSPGEGLGVCHGCDGKGSIRFRIDGRKYNPKSPNAMGKAQPGERDETCPDCGGDGRKAFRFIAIDTAIPETGDIFKMMACQECNHVISVQWVGRYVPEKSGIIA